MLLMLPPRETPMRGPVSVFSLAKPLMEMALHPELEFRVRRRVLNFRRIARRI
jgi:hypothetical protein